MKEEWEKMENSSDESIDMNDDVSVKEYEQLLDETIDLSKTIEEIENGKENENGNE